MAEMSELSKLAVGYLFGDVLRQLGDQLRPAVPGPRRVSAVPEREISSGAAIALAPASSHPEAGRRPGTG